MNEVNHTRRPSKPEGDLTCAALANFNLDTPIQMVNLRQLDDLIRLRLEESAGHLEIRFNTSLQLRVGQLETVLENALSASYRMQNAHRARENPNGASDSLGDGDIEIAAHESPGKPADDRMLTPPESQRSAYEHERITAKANTKTLENRSLWRVKLEAVIQSTWFDTFFVFLIAVNAIVMGAETWLASSQLERDQPEVFRIISIIFYFLFFLELVLRLLPAGPWEALCGRNAFWILFDNVVVVLSFPGLMLDVMYLTGADTISIDGVTNLRVFRLAKVARLLKVLRYPILQKWLRSLNIIFVSIGGTIKALSWTLLLLLVIFVFLAMIIVQAVLDSVNASGIDVIQAENPRLLEFWPNLPVACITLFMAVTGGIDYYDCTLPLRKISSFLEVLFLAYVFFALFCMFNVVTGVFCNAAIESASHDPELLAAGLTQADRQMKIQIEQVFDSLDKDGSGLLSYADFEGALKDQTVLGYFEAMNLGLAEAEEIFRLIDTSGDGLVEIGEFVEGCLKLKGGPSRVDIALLRDKVDVIHPVVLRIHDVLFSKQRDPKRALSLESSLESL